MLKWKILAVLGLAFGLAGIGWGYGQGKKAVGFFELRVYTAQPGKRDAYHRRAIRNWASAPRIRSFTCGAIRRERSGTSASRRPTMTPSLVRL